MSCCTCSWSCTECGREVANGEEQEEGTKRYRSQYNMMETPAEQLSRGNFFPQYCKCPQCEESHDPESQTRPCWMGKDQITAKFLKFAFLDWIVSKESYKREKAIGTFNAITNNKHGGHASDIIHLKKISHQEMTTLVERRVRRTDTEMLLDIAHLVLLCSWKIDRNAVKTMIRAGIRILIDNPESEEAAESPSPENEFKILLEEIRKIFKEMAQRLFHYAFMEMSDKVQLRNLPVFSSRYNMHLAHLFCAGSGDFPWIECYLYNFRLVLSSLWVHAPSSPQMREGITYPMMTKTHSKRLEMPLSVLPRLQKNTSCDICHSKRVKSSYGKLFPLEYGTSRNNNCYPREVLRLERAKNNWNTQADIMRSRRSVAVACKPDCIIANERAKYLGVNRVAKVIEEKMSKETEKIKVQGGMLSMEDRERLRGTLDEFFRQLDSVETFDLYLFLENHYGYPRANPATKLIKPSEDEPHNFFGHLDLGDSRFGSVSVPAGSESSKLATEKGYSEFRYAGRKPTASSSRRSPDDNDSGAKLFFTTIMGRKIPIDLAGMNNLSMKTPPNEHVRLYKVQLETYCPIVDRSNPPMVPMRLDWYKAFGGVNDFASRDWTLKFNVFIMETPSLCPPGTDFSRAALNRVPQYGIFFPVDNSFLDSAHLYTETKIGLRPTDRSTIASLDRLFANNDYLMFAGNDIDFVKQKCSGGFIYRNAESRYIGVFFRNMYDFIMEGCSFRLFARIYNQYELSGYDLTEPADIVSRDRLETKPPNFYKAKPYETETGLAVMHFFRITATRYMYKCLKAANLPVPSIPIRVNKYEFCLGMTNWMGAECKVKYNFYAHSYYPTDQILKYITTAIGQDKGSLAFSYQGSKIGPSYSFPKQLEGEQAYSVEVSGHDKDYLVSTDRKIIVFDGNVHLSRIAVIFDAAYKFRKVFKAFCPMDIPIRRFLIDRLKMMGIPEKRALVLQNYYNHLRPDVTVTSQISVLTLCPDLLTKRYGVSDRTKLQFLVTDDLAHLPGLHLSSLIPKTPEAIADLSTVIRRDADDYHYKEVKHRLVWLGTIEVYRAPLHRDDTMFEMFDTWFSVCPEKENPEHLKSLETHVHLWGQNLRCTVVKDRGLIKTANKFIDNSIVLCACFGPQQPKPSQLKIENRHYHFTDEMLKAVIAIPYFYDSFWTYMFLRYDKFSKRATLAIPLEPKKVEEAFKKHHISGPILASGTDPFFHFQRSPETYFHGLITSMRGRSAFHFGVRSQNPNVDAGDLFWDPQHEDSKIYPPGHEPTRFGNHYLFLLETRIVNDIVPLPWKPELIADIDLLPLDDPPKDAVVYIGIHALLELDHFHVLQSLNMFCLTMIMFCTDPYSQNHI